MSYLQNEKGALLPAAIILLLVITVMLSSFLLNFDSKYRTYDSLEMYYYQKTKNERLPTRTPRD